jgi:COP9 signalosome complex subunit 4
MQAAAISDPKARVEALITLLPGLSSSNDAAGLKAVIDAADQLALSETRQLLKLVSEAADSMSDTLLSINVCEHALEKIRPRLAQLEDCDYLFRWNLFRNYAGGEDYLRAATILGQARLESSMISDADRAKAYVRCAQNYIRADDDVNAESFIRRAGDTVYRVGDRGLLLQFKAAHAQVLDAKRKFTEAAGRYLDILRSVSEEEIGVEETTLFTEKAAICAVLAPAGPSRVRLMGSLMRMPRVREIRPAVFNALDKMQRDAFILPQDVTAFESVLLPHQKATSSDGSTLMQRAAVEHNMLACARVYKNIRLSSLAALLGVDARKAERVAATMVKERRLAASIDQVAGFLDFAPVQPAAGTGLKVTAGNVGAAAASAGSSSSSSSTSAASAVGGLGEVERVVGTSYPAAAAANSDSAEGAAQRLLAWDQRIKELCLSVNGAVEAIGSKHPALLPK